MGTATEQRACGVVTVTVALVGCVRWCAVPRGMYRIDPGRSPIGGLVGPTAVYAPLAAADWAAPQRSAATHSTAWLRRLCQSVRLACSGAWEE